MHEHLGHPAFFALVGILAGVLSGLFGIGGGIVIVPTLVAGFALTMPQANAVSLAALLLPVGILGLREYHKAGLVAWKPAGWISLGLLSGSAVGAWIALSAKETVLEAAYALFLLYNGANYAGIPRLLGRKASPERPRRDARTAWTWIGIGALAGIIAGLFGKGGGIVIVPVLIAFFGFKPKEATATSLAALQLPVGLPAVWVYAREGSLDWVAAGWIAGGILLGAIVGTRIAIGLSSATFKKVYGVFLIGVSLYLMLR